MLLDVPFAPDAGYAAFLAGKAGSIGSVHLALGGAGVPDARVLPGGVQQSQHDAEKALGILGQLSGIPIYLLLNARFHTAAIYNDPQAVRRVIRSVEAAAPLTGVIVADPLLLGALSHADPALCARLEAVPSVNCRLRTPADLDALLQVVERTGFRPPTLLVPDRELNRDLRGLEAFAAHARSRLPGVRLTLLANEGCLAGCPYRAAHEAVITHARLGGDQRPFELVRDFGCLRTFLEEPWRLLASPFIRPEDARNYEGLADGLKICGRTRGAAFLTRAVDAYLRRRWDGNLLDLLDSQESLAGRVRIDNQALPETFFATVTACAGQCTACGACAELARDHAVCTPAAPAPLTGD